MLPSFLLPMPSVSEFLYSMEMQAVRTKDSETSPVSQAFSQSQFEPEICALSPFHLAPFSTKPNGKNYHVLPRVFILITDTKFLYCLSQKAKLFPSSSSSPHQVHWPICFLLLSCSSVIMPLKASLSRMWKSKNRHLDDNPCLPLPLIDHCQHTVKNHIFKKYKSFCDIILIKSHSCFPPPS